MYIENVCVITTLKCFRYEGYIVPREEGKVQYDPSPKKMKKQKGIYKTPQVRIYTLSLCINLIFAV